jgi:hypothetical protein
MSTDVDEATSTETQQSVDINDLQTVPEGEVNFGDESADFNAMKLPPEIDLSTGKAITYQLKLKLGDKGVQKREGKRGWFLMAHVKPIIVAPGEPFDNAYLDDAYPNSIVFDETSELQHIMKLIGAPIRVRSLDEGLEHVKRILQGEPMVYGRIRWEASVLDEEATEAASEEAGTEKKKYKVVVKGERNFPEKTKDGAVVGHEPIFDHPDYGEVRARAKVVRYLAPPTSV